MIKKWIVTAEVNMDASKEVKLIIEANTQRKAVMKAKSKLEKEYFHHKIIDIKEFYEVI